MEQPRNKTMRDEFAIAALEFLRPLDREDRIEIMEKADKSDLDISEYVAEIAFTFANAMLRVREEDNDESRLRLGRSQSS